MPRGAVPTPRNVLAASEPYRPLGDVKTFVPSGEFPTPNHELVDASPYLAAKAAPERFIIWPIGIDLWGDKHPRSSIWAEEAFAKACTEPKVFIPPDVVLLTARKCGASNFSKFVQTHGFQIEGNAYLVGPFNSVDWTSPVALNSAIANIGPVKIGVALADITGSQKGQVTPGTSGWAIRGLPPTSQPKNLCASLCGYGRLQTLVDLIEHHGINVRLPSDMPTGLCYAMFIWDSIGIIDWLSLMNITGEAWVRNPTTIIKNSKSSLGKPASV